MVLCEECAPAADYPKRVNIFGVLSSIDSLDDPPYPLVYPEFCVFLSLTDGRGTGVGKISCVFDETGRTVFETPEHAMHFGPDPLEVFGFVFRIRDCPFPRPGFYTLEFWYNQEVLDARPLRLR
jgi:hypothetical protein